jgi:4-hydroxybenzoate polyprenyltransferase
MLRPAIQAMRPHQWVKNLLVFAPLMFTVHRGEPGAWVTTVLACLAFCGAASAIYIVNDIVDRTEDRRHPKKKDRPIASGALPVQAAWITVGAALAMSLLFSLLVGAPNGWAFLLWPLGYLALNLVYSFWWKRIVVVDCMCIAAGFQLRVHAGAAAIDVEASHWIALCTFFFALFLAFCKRYEEVGRQREANGGHTRATMKDYSPHLLNMMIGPLAALSILSYALYTVSPETIARHGGSESLMYTVPVVTYGVFRYLFLVYQKREGGDPARLLFRDRPLLVSGLVYVALVWLLLRGG